jgi:hypothetical protein
MVAPNTPNLVSDQDEKYSIDAGNMKRSLSMLLRYC